MFFPVSSFAMYDSILSEASFCCVPMVLSIASSPGVFTQEGRLFHKKIYQISRQFWRGLWWLICEISEFREKWKSVTNSFMFLQSPSRSIWKRQILHFKYCVTVKKKKKINLNVKNIPKTTTNPKPKSSTAEFIPCAQSQMQQNIIHAPIVLTYLRNEGMQ